MTATAVLARARAAGHELAVEADGLRCHPTPDAALLAELRRHKAELIDLLRGDRCRDCGVLMRWPAPCGVVLADRTARCLPCHDLAARRALVPELVRDEAEITLRGGLA